MPGENNSSWLSWKCAHFFVFLFGWYYLSCSPFCATFLHNCFVFATCHVPPTFLHALSRSHALSLTNSLTNSMSDSLALCPVCLLSLPKELCTTEQITRHLATSYYFCQTAKERRRGIQKRRRHWNGRFPWAHPGQTALHRFSPSTSIRKGRCFVPLSSTFRCSLVLRSLRFAYLHRIRSRRPIWSRLECVPSVAVKRWRKKRLSSPLVVHLSLSCTRVTDFIGESLTP